MKRLSDRSGSFMQSTMIMMIGSIIVKLIGFFYTIPLTSIYGAEGAGIFSSAYNIYAFLLVISSAGLPVAISRMVSEANALGRRREVKKIARLSIVAFAIIGAALSLAMIFGADAFARLVGNSMSRIAVMVLGPSIFFVAVLSAIRGYYQGLSNMIPTATSQVIEALGKLIAGLGLAYVFAKLGYSVEVVVAGAIGGVTIGTLLSTVYLVAIRLRDLQSKKGVELGGECSQSRDILKKMLKIAIPITLGASIIAITNFVDGINVMRRLQDGCMMTEPEANYLFGLLFNASKLFNLPQTLIAGIGVSVIPAITVAFTKKQGLQATKFTESAFRLTSILALPCAVGLGMLAEPILRLVFIGSKRSELADTAPILTVLSLAILSVSLVAVSVSVLQAMGKEKIPVFSMIIGGAIKIGANYVLIGTPAINIYGAPIGTFLCHTTIVVINLIAIYHYGNHFSLLKTIVKPALSAAAMGGIIYLVSTPIMSVLGDKIGLIAVIGIAAVTYGVMLLLTRTLPREDILMLPKGEKIAKILRIK